VAIHHGPPEFGPSASDAASPKKGSKGAQGCSGISVHVEFTVSPHRGMRRQGTREMCESVGAQANGRNRATPLGKKLVYKPGRGPCSGRRGESRRIPGLSLTPKPGTQLPRPSFFREVSIRFRLVVKGVLTSEDTRFGGG